MRAQILKGKEYIKKRFFEKPPTNYWCLVLQETSLSLTCFQGQQSFHHTTIDDAQFHALNALLRDFPAYPLYIVLKYPEPHFQLVSLTAAKWWHRRALLNQAKRGEFPKTEWVHTQSIPSAHDAHRYLLAGISPSLFLQTLVDNLKHLSNPVIGFQLWPIVFANQVFKILETRDEWVIILQQDNVEGWQLIVCHHQAVILSRRGQNIPTALLAQEVTSTMRYLNRHNYHQGDPVTLIQIGFEETLKFKKIPQLKVIHLKDDLSENLPIVAPFQVPQLKAHHLAFTVPQKLVKGGIPIGFGLLAASVFLFLNTHFHQQTHSILLKQQLTLKMPLEVYEHLRLSQLFQVYQSTQSPDPIPMLRKLSKILPPYAVAIDLRWTAKAAQTSLSELTLDLVIDKQSLSRKKPVPLTQSLRLYQEKVQQAFHRSYPTSQLNWGPFANNLKCSLKITYPFKK